MTLSENRSVPIRQLRDYLFLQSENTHPAEVMRLLRRIAQEFPLQSVTRRLAEQFRARIRSDWHAGMLTRYHLLLHAFPILYESAINLVDTRRMLDLIINRPAMRFRFDSPAQVLINL